VIRQFYVHSLAIDVDDRYPKRLDLEDILATAMPRLEATNRWDYVVQAEALALFLRMAPPKPLVLKQLRATGIGSGN
jgi:hypothetical protein